MCIIFSISPFATEALRIEYSLDCNDFHLAGMPQRTRIRIRMGTRTKTEAKTWCRSRLEAREARGVAGGQPKGVVPPVGVAA